MAEFTFWGEFQITTDCADLEQITRALNETARQFGDIIEWNTDKEHVGYMRVVSSVNIDLPVNEMGRQSEHDHLEEEDPEEVFDDDEGGREVS